MAGICVDKDGEPILFKWPQSAVNLAIQLYGNTEMKKQPKQPMPPMKDEKKKSKKPKKGY